MLRWLKRVPFIIWFALFSVALGTYGFQQYRGADPFDLGTLFDSLYRAVQMLTLEFDPPRLPAPVAGGDGAPAVTAPGTEAAYRDPVLGIARWIAAVATVGFIVTLITDHLGRMAFHLRHWALRRPRAVLLGFGSVNRVMAQSLIGKGFAIAAVDPDDSPAVARLARDMGVLLITGDVADPAMRNRARIATAERVVVACGDDEINVEVAGLLARELADRPAGTLRVHLSNTRLISDLANAPDVVPGRAGEPLLRPAIFGLKTAAARDMLLQAQPVREARDRGQARVHLVIVGMGDFGEAMLIEILLSGYAPDQPPPKVTVLDCEKCDTEARLRATYPQLFEFDRDLLGGIMPEIVFHEVDVERSPTEGPGSPFAALDAEPDPPTAYVFCCGLDHTNLRAALRLDASMRRRRVRAAPVYVRQWDRIPADPAKTARRSLSNIRVFGNAQVTAERLVTVEPEIEHFAKALNWRYAVEYGRLAPPETGPRPPRFADRATFDRAAADTAWAELSEDHRRANRRAARHAAVRLHDLGLRWRGTRDGVLPRIDAPTAADLRAAIDPETVRTQPAARDSLARRLYDSALCEHRRWVIERAIQGYQPGPEIPGADGRRHREDARRLHDLMVPFDALDVATRLRDLSMVCAVLDLQAAETGERPPWRDRLLARLRLAEPPPRLRRAPSVMLSPSDADGKPHVTVARIALPATPPEALAALDLAQAPEIEVTIDPGHRLDEAHRKALSAALARWRRETALACRLHVVLIEPEDFGRRIDTGFERWLAGLLALADRGIDVDLTAIPAACRS